MIVGRGSLDGVLELVAVVGDVDADGGAEVGGLDDEREAQFVLALVHDAVALAAPAAAVEPHALDHGEAAALEQQLHGDLVHAHGGAHHAGRGVGHVEQFQHALQSAVLAVEAVEDGHDHVQHRHALRRRAAKELFLLRQVV